MRRHPRKGNRWIKDKYFKTSANRHWIFAVEDRGRLYPDGKPYRVSLSRASDVPIRRHIRIRSEANPFDPKFETYFEERSTSKMRDNVRGKKRLLTLWVHQGGLCSICHQKITGDMQWAIHYISRRVDGGKDNVSNLKLTHLSCHRMVHSQSLDVVEPAATGCL
jgi:RNA-directed DNA polymerase